jgi:hypothetical protein
VAEAAPASPRSAAETVRLTIEFRESGDRRQDLDRLQRLHALLAKSPGDDPYAIVFVAGERRSRLVGDQLRLAYSQDLASTLEELLGVGCVRISAEAVAALS